MLGVGDYIEHPMISIGEVDIRVPGWPEHGFIFGRLSDECMATGIVLLGIGLDFYYLDNLAVYL